MNDLRDEATRLAERPYSAIVFLDESTEGEPVYVALNPELEGCVSQGDTVDEAFHNLNEARVDFIYFLLEDGLDVPDPQKLSGHTTFFLTDMFSTTVYENKPDYLLGKPA